MPGNPNPRQLVLRRDTATGLTLVGWEFDLPVGRFEHLDLICEVSDYILPDITSEYFATYQSALRQARQANRLMLAQQARLNYAKGWRIVPFELAHHRQALGADSFGNYAAAAMQLHYQLTQKAKQAWAVICDEAIVHVRARHPHKELDELSYQVWYHQQCYQLKKMGGMVLEGNLVVCESGLWFAANL